MIIDFSTIDLHDRPVLILRNAGEIPLGVLMNAMNVEPRLLYNEVSELNFDLPAYADGVATPMYDEVVGMRLIDLQGIGQFILLNPKESGDGVTRKKACTAYSLEYEFARKKITIPNGTYKFYDAEKPEDTLLGMLLEDMPSWKVGAVPASIANKYRTFEVNGENRYNFMKSTAQKTYGCIFNFNTYTRTVYVDDANRTPDDRPVYLSTENLATSIDVEELTKDIKTRLEVNGADGVNIRDVNPNGTNWLLDLDHYMTPLNFSPALIEKYHAWIKLNADNRQAFYSLSVRHTLSLERRVAEEAKLTDLRGEMTSLENLQAVTIQAIAQNLKDQSDLDSINEEIVAKQERIDNQITLIEELKTDADSVFEQLQMIRDACSYTNYFTEDERIEMDRYIVEDGIEESSFVAATTSYVPSKELSRISASSFSIKGSSVSTTTPASGGTIYDMKGGTLTIGSDISASVVSATIDTATDRSFVASFYLNGVTYKGESYPQACLTLSGSLNLIVISMDMSSVSMALVEADMYFTLNVSEYEKRSIAWELYEYGLAMLDKLSKPSYVFSVKSANFLVHKDFIAFRDALRLGERIYLALHEDEILTPVCIGVTFIYGDPDSLELLFGDKYVAGSGGNSLVDLLEQSVSMGKTLSSNQFAYAQFTDSGASTSIAQFMASALDVSKNALFSSSGNAVSWDGSGLRLRKWADNSQTAYDPEQMWMVNNSILLTADNWKTAQMAIGKFHDDSLGECWGVVAPTIVGTMLAGTKLVIESEKKDGGVAVFRVDGDGARLYNSNFLIANDQRSILLHPDVGMVIGPLGSYSIDDEGSYDVDTGKANFYVDDTGNVFLRGAITATELHVGNQTIEEYVGSYVAENAGGTTTFLRAEAPTTDFKIGDFWRDSDSPYHYLYTAVDTTGDPTVDWVLVSAQIIEGAAINTDANAGTIDIVSASTLSLASGGELSIAGTGAINLASTGGINLIAGQITLGSSANLLSSDGILSLANGNILLHGPNNEVTVGRGGGTVNIGTDGTGTINLATYQVKSSTESAAYTTTYSTGGKTTAANATSEFSYTATDNTGAQTSTTFTITTTYTQAELATNASPSITDGKLLQLVYNSRGINIFADTEEDEMILSPSVTNGHLMGWHLISGTNVAATNMSATTVVADSMFLPGDDGSLIAVANQKWTIDKIVEILNNNDVIPSLKSKVDNAYWRAYYHSHEMTISDDGVVTIGQVISPGDARANFKIADTQWYLGRVAAYKEAVATALADVAWNAQAATTIEGELDTDEKVLKVTYASTTIKYPDDVSATQVSIGRVDLDLSTELSAYYASAYAQGEADRWSEVQVYFPSGVQLVTYDKETNEYTVTACAAYFEGPNPSGTKSGSYTFVATGAYDAGRTSGYNSGMLDYSPTTFTPSTPAYTRPYTYTLTVTAKNVYGDDVATSGTITIDARDAYDDGYADGEAAGYEAGYKAACEAVYIDAAISSITNNAPNTMYASGYARAYVGDTQVASQSLSKTQTFSWMGQ